MVPTRKEQRSSPAFERYGLKLWSVNYSYLPEARKLLQVGICDFIEVFVIPGSYPDAFGKWAGLNTEFVIHAPHYDFGVNLSDKGLLSNNLRRIGEALKFADSLNSKRVIVHPGVGGPVEETARQLRAIGDGRLTIENKPFFGRNRSRCTGSSPEEIGFLLQETGAGLCLDIGHAICAANARRIDSMAYLDDFLKLKPNWYHLADGELNGVTDRHLHLGAGSYDLSQIMARIPRPRSITIETEKDSPERLDDFVQDVLFLRRLVSRWDEPVVGRTSAVRG